MKAIFALLAVATFSSSLSFAQIAATAPAAAPTIATAPAVNNATRPAPANAQRHQKILAQSQANPYEVVFLGDSITQGFDPELWKTHYAPLHAGNFGSSGDHTENVLWRITEGKELDGQDPKVVVLMIGVNNLWGPRGNSAGQIVEGIEAIIKTVGKKCPHSSFLLLGVLPTDKNPNDPIRQKIQAINASLAKLADGKHIRFLDFGPQMLQADGGISTEIMPDYLHPSAKGYEIWVGNVDPVLHEMLGHTMTMPASMPGM